MSPREDKEEEEVQDRAAEARDRVKVRQLDVCGDVAWKCGSYKLKDVLLPTPSAMCQGVDGHWTQAVEGGQAPRPPQP